MQRLMCTHEKIHSTAEPWLLLPLVYSFRSGSTFAEYGHTSAANAITDFIKILPHGQHTYYHAIRRLVLDVTSSACPENTEYFLDKTPRYTLILRELMEIFPDSQFLLLWRNPLAIAASMINSFGHGKWNLYKYTVDLFNGLGNMTDAVIKHPERFTAVRYEELLCDPKKVTRYLLSKLGLQGSLQIDLLDQISFNGRMGDPTGTKKYRTLDTTPLHEWPQAFRSPLRRRWAHRYLDWIGHERLSVMGYDYEEIRCELDSPSTTRLSTLLSDAGRMCYGLSERYLQIKMFRHLYLDKHHPHPHVRLF